MGIKIESIADKMHVNGEEIALKSSISDDATTLNGHDSSYFSVKTDTDSAIALKADITYVDEKIGDINCALDAINGEVI